MGVSTEDGRGNITAYAGVRDNKPVLQGDRDYSACSLDANPTASFACGGSDDPGASPAISTAAAGVHDRLGYGQHVPATTSRTSDRYNFGPAQLLPASGHALQRWARWATTSWPKLADVYTQLMFTDYTSVAQIAPGGNFFDTNTINCDNPFLSAQQLSDDRLRHGGRRMQCGRQSGDRSDVHRRVVTSKAAAVSSRSRTPRSARCSACAAQITEAWDYDASAQYSAVSADQSAAQLLPRRRICSAHWTWFDRRRRAGLPARSSTAPTRTASRATRSRSAA